MRRRYETMFVVPPLTDDKISETIEEVKANLEKLDAEIENLSEWGKRRLAYEVEDYNYGYYVVIHFYMEGNNVAKLKHFYKQNENIIRNIVIKRKDEEER